MERSESQEAARRTARAEELRSLRIIAKKFAWTEEQLVQNVIGGYKAAMMENYETYRRELNSKDPERFFAPGVFEIDKVLSPDDLFDYFQKIQVFQTETCIETLCSITPKILPQLYPSYGMDQDQLRKMLLSIPMINTFDYNVLDPSVLRISDAEYMIRNSFTFDTLASYLVCPLYANTAFDIQERRKERPEGYSEPATVARKYMEIASVYHQELLYHADFLRQIDTDIHFNGTGLVNETVGKDAYYGMQLFAFFHEYAHVLLDHFDSDRANDEIELEADTFAINALVVNTMGYYKEHLADRSWFMISILSRLMGPLLHHLTKIAIAPDLFGNQPSYLARYSYTSALLRWHIDMYGYGSEGKRLLSQLDSVVNYVLQFKGLTAEETNGVTAEYAKYTGRVRFYIYNELQGYRAL